MSHLKGCRTTVTSQQQSGEAASYTAINEEGPHSIQHIQKGPHLIHPTQQRIGEDAPQLPHTSTEEGGRTSAQSIKGVERDRRGRPSHLTKLSNKCFNKRGSLHNTSPTEKRTVATKHTNSKCKGRLNTAERRGATPHSQPSKGSRSHTTKPATENRRGCINEAIHQQKGAAARRQDPLTLRA
jgi:hypothetical protein